MKLKTTLASFEIGAASASGQIGVLWTGVPGAMPTLSKASSKQSGVLRPEAPALRKQPLATAGLRGSGSPAVGQRWRGQGKPGRNHDIVASHKWPVCPQYPSAFAITAI